MFFLHASWNSVKKIENSLQLWKISSSMTDLLQRFSDKNEYSDKSIYMYSNLLVQLHHVLTSNLAYLQFLRIMPGHIFLSISKLKKRIRRIFKIELTSVGFTCLFYAWNLFMVAEKFNLPKNFEYRKGYGS